MKIKNFKTNEFYIVQSVLHLKKDADLYQQITDICNEKLIHHWLFKIFFRVIIKAPWFISLAQKGWENESHFIFYILHENGSSWSNGLEVK